MGEMPIGQITVAQVSRLVQTMTDLGTVNKVLIFLHYAYKLALRWKVEGVICNPAAEVPNQRDGYKIERYLTPEQMRNLLAAVQRVSGVPVLPSPSLEPSSSRNPGGSDRMSGPAPYGAGHRAEVSMLCLLHPCQ